jgi:hypothetical protein
LVSEWKITSFRWYSCVVRKHPAIEGANGDKEWYQNGKLYRENGPAVEYGYESKSWYLHGMLIDLNRW